MLLGVIQYDSPLGTGAVLVAASVARALHTTTLSDYLLIFSVLTNICIFFRDEKPYCRPLAPKKNKHREPQAAVSEFEGRAPCGVLLRGGHYRGSQIWLKTTEKTVFL